MFEVAPAPASAPASSFAWPGHHGPAVFSPTVPAATAAKETALIDLPPDTICAVRGTGAPFKNGCDVDSLSITSSRDGSGRLAKVLSRGTDITWAFSEKPGRVWVGVRDGGLVLRGFATNDQTFALTREVEADPGHVWFAPNSPVRVDGAKDGSGAIVHLEEDLSGVTSLKRGIGCDALGYDPSPKITPAPVRLPPAVPRDHVIPLGSSLTLHREAGGEALTTLHQLDPNLPLPLEVVVSLGPWTRVEFQTEHARFDVWVSTSEVTRQGVGGSHGRGFGACGGSHHGFHREHVTAASDTEVIVSSDPKKPGPSGVVLEKDASVGVISRKDGFVEIASEGSISPPDGLSFWVRETALSPKAP